MKYINIHLDIKDNANNKVLLEYLNKRAKDKIISTVNPFLTRHCRLCLIN